MILGVGIDIEEIEKIAISIQSPAFVRKNFTPDEVALCEGKHTPAQHFAGKFTVKEAFMKAIGAGIRQGVWFSDIEVLNRETGAPYIALHREAKRIAEELGIHAIHVSLSHSAGVAVGVVIIEG